MSRRYTVLPPIDPQPRILLDKECHRDVDANLKALKKVKRHLTSNLQALRDERDILERLYYKGKNQHAASLFWKRVTETRRYAQRLDDVRLLEIVDALYSSFFGATSSVQKTKGSWTHTPSKEYPAFALRRHEGAAQLLEKTHRRLQVCYKHLILAMQSGAFVQVIVLCAAVVSRLQTYSQDILFDVHKIIALLQQLLDILKRPPTNEDMTSNTSTVPTKLALSIPEPVVLHAPSPPRPALQTTKPKRPKKKKAFDDIDAIFGL